MNVDPEERLRQRFHALDINRTGFISRETVAQILKDQGDELEQLMVVLLFEKYDRNSDTLIDINEYITFCLEMGGLSEREILRKIFDLCDLDRNGTLDVTEVKRLGHMMGLDVSISDAYETLKAFDANSDNTVDFEEFCAILGQ